MGVISKNHQEDKTMLLYVVIFSGILVTQLKVAGGKPVDVKVVKKIEVVQTYYLLDKSAPIEVEVAGPALVRFYTRLVFTDKSRKKGQYSIVVEEDTVRQKIVSKFTEVSKGARWNGYRVGKWRSFVVEVPPGRHIYKLYLFDATFDSVLIRPVVQEGYSWKEVKPISPSESIVAVEDNSPVRYYLSRDGRFVFSIEGPAKVRVAVRYNFKAGESEPQTVRIKAVLDGNQLENKEFSVIRSRSVYYQDRPEFTPSHKKALWLDIPAGKHTMKISVKPSSTAIRLLISANSR